MSKKFDVNSIALLDLETDLGVRLQNVEGKKGTAVGSSRVKKHPIDVNRGVESRRMNDATQSETARIHNALSRKEKLYDGLKKNLVTIDDRDALLVDFNRKRECASQDEASTEEDVDDVDQEMIEILDDLGRTRMVPKKHLHKYVEHEKESMTIKQFLRQGESHDPMLLVQPRVDAGDGVRNRGTGYYRLSTVEDERQRQLSELNEWRKETVEQQKLYQAAIEEREQSNKIRLEKFKKRLAALSIVKFV